MCDNHSQLNSASGLPSRREILRSTAIGFGAIAADVLLSQLSRSAESLRQPLDQQPPHFAPRAKRVIFLFMKGGPSHLDTRNKTKDTKQQKKKNA